MPIRPDQVAELARRGWSVPEMAGFFACDRGTLYKRFAAELPRARAPGPPSPPCFGPGCLLHRG